MRDDEGIPAEIEAKVGGEFTISLDSNPTTGYVWEPRFDRDYVELTGRDYEVSSDRIGAGGREILHFIGTRKGRTKVEMALRRRWEDRPLRTKSFSITIG